MSPNVPPSAGAMPSDATLDIETPAPDPATTPTPTRASANRASGWQRVIKGPGFQGSITFVAFIAVFAGYSIWLGSEFSNTAARLLDVHQNAPVVLLGLAVLVTLIAGQFDLSVASMATLTTFLSIGLKINQGWPFALVIVVCLGIGLVGGLINGLLVVRAHVNTFIATLGTGGLFVGLSQVYSHGTQLSPSGAKNALPGWFSGPVSLGAFGDKFPAILVWIAVIAAAVGAFMGLRRQRPERLAARTWDMTAAGIVVVVLAILIFGLHFDNWITNVSWTIAVLLIVATALWVLLSFTTYGRYLHAVGSNPEAARLAGVNPGKETIKAFVIGGLLAALAGVLLAANQGSASPDVAAGYLLPAFAAAFLSTVVLSTGAFKVWGTVIGGIFLIWVSQGLIVGGLAFTWTDFVNGFVLILAVALSSVFRRTT